MTLSRPGSTRENILAAGLKLFSNKGFMATTTREIASEAGIAEVTLFRHFSTKEKLFEKVIETFSIIPTLAELLPRLKGLPTEEGLKLLSKTILEGMTSRKNWIILMHGEVRRNPEKLMKVYHSFLDRFLQDIAEYFRGQQSQGAMGTFNPDLAARAFYGMIFCFFNTEEVLWRKKYSPTDRDEAISEFVRLFLSGTAPRYGNSPNAGQSSPVAKGGKSAD